MPLWPFGRKKRRKNELAQRHSSLISDHHDPQPPDSHSHLPPQLHLTDPRQQPPHESTNPPSLPPVASTPHDPPSASHPSPSKPQTDSLATQTLPVTIGPAKLTKRASKSSRKNRSRSASGATFDSSFSTSATANLSSTRRTSIPHESLPPVPSFPPLQAPTVPQSPTASTEKIPDDTLPSDDRAPAVNLDGSAAANSRPNSTRNVTTRSSENKLTAVHAAAVVPHFPPTLQQRPKRASAGPEASSTPKSKRASRRKSAVSVREREREIRSFSAASPETSLPPQWPPYERSGARGLFSRTSPPGQPFTRAGGGGGGSLLTHDTRRISTAPNRRLERPVSEISLPQADSVRSSMSGAMDLSQSFGLRALDVLTPRPTLTYQDTPPRPGIPSSDSARMPSSYQQTPPRSTHSNQDPAGRLGSTPPRRISRHGWRRKSSHPATPVHHDQVKDKPDSQAPTPKQSTNLQQDPLIVRHLSTPSDNYPVNAKAGHDKNNTAAPSPAPAGFDDTGPMTNGDWGPRARMDDLADDLDAHGLRELMERDRRRRDRQRKSDHERLMQKLERSAAKQRQKERAQHEKSHKSKQPRVEDSHSENQLKSKQPRTKDLSEKQSKSREGRAEEPCSEALHNVPVQQDQEKASQTPTRDDVAGSKAISQSPPDHRDASHALQPQQASPQDEATSMSHVQPGEEEHFVEAVSDPRDLQRIASPQQPISSDTAHADAKQPLLRPDPPSQPAPLDSKVPSQSAPLDSPASAREHTATETPRKRLSLTTSALPTSPATPHHNDTSPATPTSEHGSPLERETPVIETATAVRLSSASMSPPLLPEKRDSLRLSARLSQIQIGPIIEPPAKADPTKADLNNSSTATAEPTVQSAQMPGTEASSPKLPTDVSTTQMPEQFPATAQAPDTAAEHVEHNVSATDKETDLHGDASGEADARLSRQLTESISEFSPASALREKELERPHATTAKQSSAATPASTAGASATANKDKRSHGSWMAFLKRNSTRLRRGPTLRSRTREASFESPDASRNSFVRSRGSPQPTPFSTDSPSGSAPPLSRHAMAPGSSGPSRRATPPQRHASKFREDLPEMPRHHRFGATSVPSSTRPGTLRTAASTRASSRARTPNRSRTTSGAASPYIDHVSKVQTLDDEARASTPMGHVHPLFRDEMGQSAASSRARTRSSSAAGVLVAPGNGLESPLDGGPSSRLLSQSLASVDSEGSWLSGGRGNKRASIRESQGSMTPRLLEDQQEWSASAGHSRRDSRALSELEREHATIVEEPSFARQTPAPLRSAGPGGLTSQLQQQSNQNLHEPATNTNPTGGLRLPLSDSNRLDSAAVSRQASFATALDVMDHQSSTTGRDESGSRDDTMPMPMPFRGHTSAGSEVGVGSDVGIGTRDDEPDGPISYDIVRDARRLRIVQRNIATLSHEALREFFVDEGSQAVASGDATESTNTHAHREPWRPAQTSSANVYPGHAAPTGSDADTTSPVSPLSPTSTTSPISPLAETTDSTEATEVGLAGGAGQALGETDAGATGVDTLDEEVGPAASASASASTVHRAMSVDYGGGRKGHARHVSAGSARLLDIGPRAPTPSGTGTGTGTGTG